MSVRDLALLLLVASSLAGSGCTEKKALARLSDQPPAAAPVVEPATPVEKVAAPAPASAIASPGDLVLTGTLEPHRRSTISAQTSGPVARVHVQEGQMVKRGAVLVSLETEQFVLMQRQAEAGLEGAKVQLESAKLEWDRHKALLADRAVPRSQFDMVDARYKGARVAEAAAQVSLAMARKALRDAVSRAPYAGLVVKKHVSEGDYATSMPPSPLITLEEVGLLDLRVQVPAGDLGRVRANDWVGVRFPALGREVRARIGRVVSSIDPRTRTFAAIAEIDNSKGELRPGLFAEIRPVSAPAARAGAGR